ncbi:MAG: helix-turn-helix domain-containing protein [Gaiellales bacterium]
MIPPHTNFQPDALDEMVAEYAAQDPQFIALYESARRRRALLRELAQKRQEQARSQTEIAALMSTSQSALARLETKASDARLSTIDRLADALGYSVEYRLVPRARSGSAAAP